MPVALVAALAALVAFAGLARPHAGVLPSLAQDGDRRLATDAWFEPAAALLHEGG